MFNEAKPDFDGETYDRKLDHKRLSGQLGKVHHALSGGSWWTLRQLANLTSAPEASVSARIRDLRKEKFGGYKIKTCRFAGGLWKYRMVM